MTTTYPDSEPLSGNQHFFLMFVAFMSLPGYALFAFTITNRVSIFATTAY